MSGKMFWVSPVSPKNLLKSQKILKLTFDFLAVCDDHVFKDEYLFYKFRVDDGSLFIEPELEIYSRGIMLHQR